jgi:hypothetical protein
MFHGHHSSDDSRRPSCSAGGRKGAFCDSLICVISRQLWREPTSLKYSSEMGSSHLFSPLRVKMIISKNNQDYSSPQRRRGRKERKERRVQIKYLCDLCVLCASAVRGYYIVSLHHRLCHRRMDDGFPFSWRIIL